MAAHRKALPAAVLTALALALPGTLNAASAAAPPPAARKVTARPQQIVSLPTGDQVRLRSTSSTTTQVLAKPAARSGPARVLTTVTLGGDTYAIPLIAQPYLGTVLDPHLFDVTALAKAAPRDGQIAVRLSYSGARPSVPGVSLTSASAGTASGYITTSSARTFQSALLKQWKADSKAKFPTRTTLFGASRITAELPGSGVVSPQFPMVTLIVKAIGPDGKPADQAFGTLVNIDDQRKFVGFFFIADGQARVSVPKGNYAAVFDYAIYDEATDIGSDLIQPVDQYSVTAANQTLTGDLRRATATPSVTTPKPATALSVFWQWTRTDTNGNPFGYGVFFDDSFSIKLAPTARSTIGKQYSQFGWNLADSQDQPAYFYDLAQLADHVASDLAFTFTAKNLAATTDRLYTDGPSHPVALYRYPVYADLGSGAGGPDLTGPATRKGWVGALGTTPKWEADGFANDSDFDDPGWTFGQAFSIPAGTTHQESWWKAPIGVRIPTEYQYQYCWACRTSTAMEIGFPGASDSDPTHEMAIFGAADGLPVARFRLYQDDALVFDGDDYTGTNIDVPAKAATYRAVYDLDRRLTDYTQSTRISTEVTFSSASAQGPKKPDWLCFDTEGNVRTDCRVLPLVQASLSLPTSLKNTLPAGRSSISVTAGQIPGAAPSAVTAVTLEVRYPGDSFQTVKLTAAGGGTYTGTVNNSGYAGQSPDVRITATDAAGSTFKQTILKAYTVAGA